jgi:hypothetical protein
LKGALPGSKAWLPWSLVVAALLVSRVLLKLVLPGSCTNPLLLLLLLKPPQLYVRVLLPRLLVTMLSLLKVSPLGL